MNTIGRVEQMARLRKTLLLFGVLLAIIAFAWLCRLGLGHFGEPHQRFQYGSQAYHQSFAAACDSLLETYGTNARTLIFSDPACLAGPLSETNFVSEGLHFADIPAAKAHVPQIIAALHPVLITVHGDEVVSIDLYRPARGGFHIRWNRRPWDYNRDSLFYFWDPERSPTIVYREEPRQSTPSPVMQLISLTPESNKPTLPGGFHR